jgi:thiol-disulfide isomerase/thioredoxin
MKRAFALVAALVLIIGAIWFLEHMKAMRGAAGPAQALTQGSVHSAQYEADKLLYPRAMEFVSPDGYINTPATTTLDYLVNHEHNVVLIDFWTYSCINCQRTIPYLEAWYNKYKDYGLVIVGVHSPEFGFEKVLANVQVAVEKFGITYPVLMDSAMNTWGAYQNQYWPAEYVVDIDGLVREHSIGEGNYEKTEAAIQALLAERAVALGLSVPIPGGFVDVSQTVDAASPETYFGASRNEYLGNGQQHVRGTQTLSAPLAPLPNTLYLSGAWNFEDEYAENTSGAAKIVYHYDAQNVYLVASSKKGVVLTIYVDGKLISTDRGADVDAEGRVHVQESRLYKLIESKTKQEHVIQINVSAPGLDAYTFTFG